MAPHGVSQPCCSIWTRWARWSRRSSRGRRMTRRTTGSSRSSAFRPPWCSATHAGCWVEQREIVFIKSLKRKQDIPKVLLHGEFQLKWYNFLTCTRSSLFIFIFYVYCKNAKCQFIFTILIFCDIIIQAGAFNLLVSGESYLDSQYSLTMEMQGTWAQQHWSRSLSWEGRKKEKIVLFLGCHLTATNHTEQPDHWC